MYGTLVMQVPLALLSCLLLIAAYIDAKTRRLPHPLAALMLLAAVLVLVAPLSEHALAGVPLAAGTFERVGWRVLLAGGTAAALLAFEALWRSAKRISGLGVGDIKLLGIMMLADPSAALLSFAGGLLALGLVCVLARLPSLPLIPFFALCWFWVWWWRLAM